MPHPPQRGVARALVALVCALTLASGLLAPVVSPPPAAAATPAPTGLAKVSTSSTAMALRWNAVASAPRYRIQYSTSSSMSNAVYARFTPTRAEITGLKPATAYFVKVRVISASGANLSGYSPAVTIVTQPKTGMRYLSPAGQAVTSVSSESLNLAWGSRGAGLSYRVQYSTSATMSDPRYVRTSTPSLSLGKLKASSAYYWRVRVITAAGVNLSDYSAATGAKTAAAPPRPAPTAPLRVASFNVKCANCFSNLPDELPWAERRDTVVASIRAQDPDVLGVQEASQGWLKDAAGAPIDLSQFEDLTQRLGPNYALSNANRNNCVKAKTPTNCVYADQGASQGTKIIYRTDRLEMLAQGSKRLTSIDTTSNARYVAWGVFKQKSTGKKFVFATTHLEPTSDAAGQTQYYNLRVTQATEVVAAIKAANPQQLPVILTGDLNSNKWTVPANGPYEALLASGLKDPLGNAYRSTTSAPGASVEKRINTFYASYNGFARVAPVRPTWVNGTHLDYILSSPMRVSEFETVVQVDAAGRFVGVIPSDHAMMRATVHLP